MGEWSNECARVEWTEGAIGPVEGARFVGHNQTGPRGMIKWSRRGRVLAADPGREFAFATEEGGQEGVVWRYRFEPAEGGTRVTESYEVTRIPMWARILDVPTNRHRALLEVDASHARPTQDRGRGRTRGREPLVIVTAHPDGVDVLTSVATIPSIGSIPINAFVVHGSVPFLVDTGSIVDADEFMTTLRSVVDPAELEWIWLTHTDFDHIGSLHRLLAENPRLRVITSFVGVGIMGLFEPLPMDRVFLINPGQTVTIGDRTLTAVKPPTFDNPITTGFHDSRTGALFSADCFGAVLDAVPPDAADIPPDAAAGGPGVLGHRGFLVAAQGRRPRDSRTTSTRSGRWSRRRSSACTFRPRPDA